MYFIWNKNFTNEIKDGRKALKKPRKKGAKTSKRLNRSGTIFCGTSRDPRGGLWMNKFSKICLHQNSIFEEKKVIKSVKFFAFVLLTRTLMFENKIKDGREAP